MKEIAEKWERFLGFTLNINPVLNLLGVIGLSISRRNRFKKITEDRLNLYLWGGLAISGLISVITAYNPLLALPSYFIPFVFIWLYILGRWYIDNPLRFFKDMIRGTALLGLLTILFYFLRVELVISGVRLIGRFSPTDHRGYILGMGDNGLAMLLQAGVVACPGIMFIVKDNREKIKYLLYFLLSMGGLIISNSRGAMVGVFVGIIILGLFISWKIIVISGSLGGLAVAFIPQLLRRVKSIFGFAEMNRVNIYKGVLRMIADHPWFGIGPGNFNLVYPSYRLTAEYEHVLSPHSNFLAIFSGWGIIGGVLFYGWLFFVMIRGWLSGGSKYKKIIVAVLVSFWVHVLINDLFAAYTAILLGCLDNPNFNREPKRV